MSILAKYNKAMEDKDGSIKRYNSRRLYIYDA